MSTLHEALTQLRPKDYSDVPIDDLGPFLRNVFDQAEIIANSVPPPPGGDDFLTAQPTRTEARPASAAADMTVSRARPPPPDPSHAELYSSWGKAIKLSAKENPLEMSVYKMAGKDRHGAWFGRRSIHEGLGFSKWKKAMQLEFAESLAVQGAPGEGNVRGIGGDKRLEKVELDGVGKVEVYQLSAQFPGPVAPREFVTLLLTSDNALTEKSAPHVDSPEVIKEVPRHFLIVSIPVTHPDAPARNGLVRGQYESVEMIREIPLPKSKTTSNVSLADETGDASEADFDVDVDDAVAERNPVEWIMVTRSDPGGGIPRFMVERGTPGSIVTDASKFLDWACAKDENDLEDGSKPNDAAAESTRKSIESKRFSVVENNAYLAGVGESIADRPSTSRTHSKTAIPTASDPQPAPVGIISSIAASLPTVIQTHLPGSFVPDSSPSSSSDSESTLSFASADEFASSSDPSTPIPSSNSAAASLSSIEPRALDDTDSTNSGIPSPAPSRHQKELDKIARQRTDLEDKLTKQRQRAESRAAEESKKGEQQASKAREKHARQIKQQQEKYEKEMARLEAKREKEARRLLDRQRKEQDRTELAKVKRERDESVQRALIAEKEAALLQLRVGELQRENTALVGRVGRMDGGLEVLREVRDEVGGGLGGPGSGKGSSGRSRGASSVSLASSGRSARTEGSVEKEKDKEKENRGSLLKESEAVG
ncbi:hypothetical protein EJ05DRAFT_476254 [Pseudovirgaria hyperparasitica]|uniref:DUF3074 domain-containing protein n=1 Tax=Pseudovirgaria hyperparasitica TaxID=470096 RepID=A0A6A6W7V2_9PEZI|nr:uncharacterized protein EJ05DRAFT_476254 [Pseudovirgaria hyperparasitica]KAF2757966.1 hypothetical protein EJ05DRAFT_476254 [Pseudovirgaria hyperparasitica]